MAIVSIISLYPIIRFSDARAGPYTGTGLEIGFNNRYLMEALKYAPADEVCLELNTGISPCVITPVEGEEKFLYMVLPVRQTIASRRFVFPWALSPQITLQTGSNSACWAV